MHERQPTSLFGDSTPASELKKGESNALHVTSANVNNFGISLPPILPNVIKEREYSDCSSLITMIIGDEIVSIENYAFRNCENLCAIVLPKDLNKIGIGAFSNCKNLQKIIYQGTMLQWRGIRKNLCDRGSGNYTVICTDGTLSKNDR